MQNKAIEKRVDSLLNQSPKALAAMASQITDDSIKSLMEGSTEEDAMKATAEFNHKYVKPMDERTYNRYRDEYTLLREHHWMYMWFKAEARLAESCRNHLKMHKVALTLYKLSSSLIKAYDTIRDYIGTPRLEATPEVCEGFDVDAELDRVTAELEKAETTVREWSEPEIWNMIGHEPPVTDA